MVTGERHRIIEKARMGVSIQDWPEGGPGIRVDIADDSYIFTVEGAMRLQEALLRHVEMARSAEAAQSHAAG